MSKRDYCDYVATINPAVLCLTPQESSLLLITGVLRAAI